MPNWVWKEENSQEKEAGIFDLDGVISDAAHRQHFLHRPEKDWAGFFGSCPEDPIITSGLLLARLANESIEIIILTARPFAICDQTLDWLESHDVPWQALIMRSEDDPELSPEMKRIALNEIRAKGFTPTLAIDDDPRNIEMYQEEGIPSIYVYSGYYE